MPVLKVIIKGNVYEKEIFFFKNFWHNICVASFSRIPTLTGHLLLTACEYSMFLQLTKIKSQNIEVIDDKKSVLNLKPKSKLVKL